MLVLPIKKRGVILMEVNNLIAKVGAAVFMGYVPDVTAEKVEKRLQEARKEGNKNEIHFLEEMLKIHKLKEGKE